MQNLLTNGYYTGTLEDIVTDTTEFDSHINIVKDCFTNKKESTFRYRNVVQMHPEYSMHVELSDLENRRNIIKTNNYSIGQQWYESYSVADINPSKNYFRNIIKKFIRKAYPNIRDDFSNFKVEDSFTVFANGDFIEPHIDGDDNGRLCVVLIYLSDREDYNGSGDFIISDLGIKISPVKNNFMMLDFTLNNMQHEVQEVTGDFLRYTYIGFVYDTDIEKNYEKL
jgi:hypothetical protein